MIARSRLAAAALTLFVAANAVVGPACTSNVDADPTPVRTFKITPAANATVSPVVSVVSSPTIPPPPSGTPGGANTIVIAGVGQEFDVEGIEARAGTVTITFDNRDSGVIHNIHVYRGSDNDGESVAESELEAGPIEQTVTFEASPGEYYYVCDAHPTTMEGTLTVE